MIFGLSKRDKVVARAEQYCRTMFAGLELTGKPVPNSAFGDAYVLGFLVQLIRQATLETVGEIQPGEMLQIQVKAIDKLVPGYGEKLILGMAEAGNESHPSHQNLIVGMREGAEYVGALQAGNESDRNELMMGFRTFVKREYMGLPS